MGLNYYVRNGAPHDLNTSKMDIDQALGSIYKGTGSGDVWGYTQVISPPSFNQPGFIYLRDNVTGLNPKPSMLAAKGYWVFMVNSGTLNGFTSTPLP